MKSELSEENLDLRDLDVKFGAMKVPEDCWAGFGSLLEQAKERERTAKEHVPSIVVVDFGELSLSERRIDKQRVEDNKEHAIRRALALSSEEPIWCMCFSINLSASGSRFLQLFGRQ